MVKKFASILGIMFGIMIIFSTIVSADEMFRTPAYINPFGGYELRAEFDDCDYSVIDDGVLRRFDNETPQSEELAKDVSDFITDNKTLYYVSYDEEKQGIYKVELSTKQEVKVFEQSVALEGCWQNKYLYYSVYDENNADAKQSTWLLNLDNGQKQMLFPNHTTSFYVTKDKLFYSPWTGAVTETDIYTSDLDGSNARIIINNINGYEDGSFRPQNNITRAEFAKIICSIFILSEGIYFDECTDKKSKEKEIKTFTVLSLLSRPRNARYTIFGNCP